MRYALPLWHCLNQEAQEALRKLLPETFVCPKAEWMPWVDPELQRNIDWFKAINTAKFMSRAPINSRRV